MSLTKEYKHRFRGIRALYGEDTLVRLANSHVCIVGSGGVGSWCIEAIVRSGVGKVTIIDNDIVDESNTNRQLHTLKENYGEYKVNIMKDRMESINPDGKINKIANFLDKNNISELVPKDVDAIVDAIDSLPSKAALIDYAIKNKIFIVVAGGAGGKTDPQSVTVSDLAKVTNDKLLARLRTVLRKQYDYPSAGHKMKIIAVYSDQAGVLSKNVSTGEDLPDFGANMCVTATVGLNLASLVLEKIRKN